MVKGNTCQSYGAREIEIVVTVDGIKRPDRGHAALRCQDRGPRMVGKCPRLSMLLPYGVLDRVHPELRWVLPARLVCPMMCALYGMGRWARRDTFIRTRKRHQYGPERESRGGIASRGAGLPEGRDAEAYQPTLGR